MEDFTEHLSYVAGEFDSERSMEHLRDAPRGDRSSDHTSGGRFYYCATPPVAYPSIVKRLGESGLHTGAKIVVEKPFGHDLESARALNAEIHAVFDESQIFRIDHYLGKETVQNILAFRFANGMFEPIWNRRYVDNVQITVAEEIGIEGRGQFYEQTGTIRDMVATHLFQVLTFLAMEPPVSFDPDRLRDEKVKVLRCHEGLDPRDVGPRPVHGVPPGARRGARLTGRDVRRPGAAHRQLAVGRRAVLPANRKEPGPQGTEITLGFREVPVQRLQGDARRCAARPRPPDDPRPARRGHHGRAQRQEARAGRLRAGSGRDAFDYEETFRAPLVEAYETLLLEAMEGDHTLFTREDEVERAWEILMPVLDDPPPVRFYEKGSWGPCEADELILPHHWHISKLARCGPSGRCRRRAMP